MGEQQVVGSAQENYKAVDSSSQAAIEAKRRAALPNKRLGLRAKVLAAFAALGIFGLGHSVTNQQGPVESAKDMVSTAGDVASATGLELKERYDKAMNDVAGRPLEKK